MGLRVEDLGLRVEDLGLGVEDMGLEVEDSDLRVEGSGDIWGGWGVKGSVSGSRETLSPTSGTCVTESRSPAFPELDLQKS